MKLRPLTALFVLAAGVLLALGLSFLRTPRAIVLVRHAERADSSRDTLLSAAGETRALHLADTLAGLGVRTIYVTEYKRTQQTAQPLAERLGLTPVVVAANNSAALVRKLRRGDSRDAALVVGHSDTLPALIKQLGVSEPVEIRPDEFHHLYIVVMHPWGRPTLLRLHY